MLLFAEWSAAINTQNPTTEEITLAGWSLAAIGRAVSVALKPEDIEQEVKRFQDAWRRHFERLKPLSDLYSQHNELLQKRKAHAGNVDALKDIEADIRRLHSKIQEEERNVGDIAKKGVLHSVLAEDCIPVGYLMHVLTDTAGNYNPFLKQGVIMGLLDYFASHRDNPHVKPLFEQLIAARAGLIADAREMSFFEVRVPYTCTPDEYAAILKTVLHCANPSLQYVDTVALVRTAVRSIPGVMTLLCHYPLRLIDPGNAGKEGFYDFEPFKHALWTQYIPPKGSGQVTRRYHQVLDMTIPNATGLNVRLFMDLYRLVPVLFHEYLHFLEDHNEASVFLRTQMFSLRFYRRQRSAKPTLDSAFVVLCDRLGKPPDAQRVRDLNELIVKHYGEQKDMTAARKDADRLVAFMNSRLMEMRQQETWHPEIWYPVLGSDGDTCGELIRGISIRFATTPRTITGEEFRRIVRNYMPDRRIQ